MVAGCPGKERLSEAELPEASRGWSVTVFIGLEGCTTTQTNLKGGVAIPRVKF